MSYPSNIHLRACALCIQNNTILLAKHKRFLEDKNFPDDVWVLPGGRVNLGETLQQCAQRELLEETGLKGEIGKLLCIKELVFPFPSENKPVTPLTHNVSFVFQCDILGGKLHTGQDPERGENQLIIQVKWIPLKYLHKETLYPYSLKDFILEGAKNNFEDIFMPFFDSKA